MNYYYEWVNYLVLDCMHDGICECCEGLDSPVYVDTNGWDQVVGDQRTVKSSYSNIIQVGESGTS